MALATAIITLLGSMAQSGLLDKLMGFIMQIFALLSAQQQTAVATKVASILTGNANKPV